MFNELFEHDYGTGNKVKDDTDITTTLLYFSTPELNEFKKLCKVAMKREFGIDYIQKGNLSDLLLIILRRENEQHTEVNVEKDTDGYRSGETYREILDRPAPHPQNIE